MEKHLFELTDHRATVSFRRDAAKTKTNAILWRHFQHRFTNTSVSVQSIGEISSNPTGKPCSI